MSFEGYNQCVCKNGHYFEEDAMMVRYDGSENCPDCGAEAAWVNCVDDTNCDSYGKIPYEMLREKYLAKKAEVETCECCGHAEEVSPEEFKVPTREETDPMRHYRPGYGSTVLVPIPKR